MSAFNRSRRLLIAEIIEKGLDPTLPYSKLDKKGKLTGVPDTKQKKNPVEQGLSLQQNEQHAHVDNNTNPVVEEIVAQVVEYKKLEVTEEVERMDLSSKGDGLEKKVKKNTKKKKD